MPDLRSIWRPALYHRHGKRPPFFEGWYFKLVDAGELRRSSVILSPFLGWRGGKALASTFGVWTALTVPFGPFVMGGSVFVFNKLLNTPGWAVMAALLTLLAFLLMTGVTLPWVVTWIGTVTILAWTHRADLRQQPRLRRPRTPR